LINRRGYVFGDPYGLRGVPRPSWGPIQHRVDMERLKTAQAPVYYVTPPPDMVDAGVQFANRGLVYQASLGPKAAQASPDQEPWPKSSDLLPGGPERYDYVTRKLAIGYSSTRAQDLWEKARYAEALPWFQDAARVGFDFPAARMNLSVAAAAAGKAEMTLAELLAALKLAPYDPEPSARLAVLFAVAGRYRDAAYYFERAYRIQPSAQLAGNAARAWSLAGERKRAQYWEARG
jgi:tetratricopeptide (TPR) repeat protein